MISTVGQIDSRRKRVLSGGVRGTIVAVLVDANGVDGRLLLPLVG